MIQFLIEKYRTWKAYRSERRRAARRAEMRALLMIAGGTLTPMKPRR